MENIKLTHTDIDALVMFKDYTFLQLKSFWWHLQDEGNFSEYEEEVIKKAIGLHSVYTSYKLKQNKK